MVKNERVVQKTKSKYSLNLLRAGNPPSKVRYENPQRKEFFSSHPRRTQMAFEKL
jgi:hypothetical protein